MAAVRAVICLFFTLAAFYFIPVKFNAEFTLHTRLEGGLSVDILGYRAEIAIQIVFIPFRAEVRVKKGNRIKRGGGKPILKFKDALFTAKKILKKLRLTNAEFSIRIGLQQDAACTAILTGIAQSAVYASSPFFRKLFRQTDEDAIFLSILPDYTRDIFLFHGKCIAVTRLGHVIFALFHMLKT